MDWFISKFKVGDKVKRINWGKPEPCGRVRYEDMFLKITKIEEEGFYYIGENNDNGYMPIFEDDKDWEFFK